MLKNKDICRDPIWTDLIYMHMWTISFFYCLYSITEKSEDEEYFYIDILHGGAIVGRNDCPRTRGRRCPIESFNKHNEISPTEVGHYLYILLNLEISSKNITD